MAEDKEINQKSPKYLLAGLVILIILIVGAVTWASQSSRVEEPQPIETSKPTNGQLVGGVRDEHGCLGSAGYRFNEEIGACVRDWELDENQSRAAKTAVITAGLENPTVVEVLSARCPGCFSVTLESGKNRIKIQLENWQVVD